MINRWNTRKVIIFLCGGMREKKKDLPRVSSKWEKFSLFLSDNYFSLHLSLFRYNEDILTVVAK